MTTHAWKSGATGGLYDPANYVDGQPFEPGDTLVFDGAAPSWTGALDTGTYLFNGSGGSNTLSLTNATLDGSSTLAESGAGQFTISSFGQFVNAGSLEVGSTAAAGVVVLDDYASVTNNGQMTAQNGSTLQVVPFQNTSFTNAGTITATTGSDFLFLNGLGYAPGTGNSFVNDGLIRVSAPDGRGPIVEIGASFSGSGTVSVQGAPGAAGSTTGAAFQGPATGTFDVASGFLQFKASPVQGTINFEDNDGLLSLVTSFLSQGPVPYAPLEATINHFAAGDQIATQGGANATSLSYDPTTHNLYLYDQDQQVARFTLAGQYTASDFQFSSPSFSDNLITTTNSLNGTQTVALGGSFSGDNGNPIIDTQGNATVTTGTGASTVYLAGGNNLVRAQGNDTIVSSTGNDTVYASSPLHDEAGSTGRLTFVSAGYSTVTGGGEAMTVFGGSGGGNVVRGGAGLTEFIGGGGSGSDFIGGQGAEIVFGGTGGDTISGGAAGGFICGANAATTISGSTGNSTITAGNGNTVLLNGAASNLVAAGSGNVTLVGGGSTGNNSVFGGGGTDLLAGGAGADFFRAGTGTATMTGGGGADLFAFDHASGGGNTVITDFQNGIDHLTLQGYGSNAVAAALGSATVSGGSTFLSLQDGTHVTLGGVTNLTAAAFV